jgi:putative transposase
MEAPGVHQALRHQGIPCAPKRVARLMRTEGLVGRCKRRFTKTTFPDPEAAAVDLVKRAFGPGSVELDRVYVGDITYIRTWEGWLYLATVIDLSSRRVVGWSMADHMRAELVCDALTMAIEARRPEPGLVFHSDRGTQYTSAEYLVGSAASLHASGGPTSSSSVGNVGPSSPCTTGISLREPGRTSDRC